jgi:hypothetical protein
MRSVGFILIVVGFLAVMHLASSRISHALWVARQQREALPQQEAFTRKDVEEAILKATLASRSSGAAAVLPGFLILCGAIVLDCAKARRRGGDHGA